MNENEKEKLLEEGYESVKFRASDFLPNGKLANGDEIIDVTGVLAQCPLCYAPCDEKSYVIMTDSHMLYPCWSCDKLVEKERSDDFPEAFA